MKMLSSRHMLREVWAFYIPRWEAIRTIQKFRRKAKIQGLMVKFQIFSRASHLLKQINSLNRWWQAMEKKWTYKTRNWCLITYPVWLLAQHDCLLRKERERGKKVETGKSFSYSDQNDYNSNGTRWKLNVQLTKIQEIAHTSQPKTERKTRFDQNSFH